MKKNIGFAFLIQLAVTISVFSLPYNDYTYKLTFELTGDNPNDYIEIYLGESLTPVKKIEYTGDGVTPLEVEIHFTTDTYESGFSIKPGGNSVLSMTDMNMTKAAEITKYIHGANGETLAKYKTNSIGSSVTHFIRDNSGKIIGTFEEELDVIAGQARQIAAPNKIIIKL